MPRKICVVTGSRAEYGLLYWVLREIEKADDLELQLVVTGMHLSHEFGFTCQQIEDDGFRITHRVDMQLSSDTAAGIAKSMGLGLIGFADSFKSLQPDIVLMLGDRFELLAAASAALVAALPIAHIHGGEVTAGAFDEAIRHSITKMSHIHFTATEIYRQRVVQLGEHPSRVFNVGAPGLDNIHRLKLLSRSELEDAIKMKLGSCSLLVTWHPVTLEPGRTRMDCQVLLNALAKVDGLKVIFTKANADTEGRIINQLIDEFVLAHSGDAVVYRSLGQLRYLSAMKHVDGVVGNSSSGIIEAPSFQVGTVNIGDRQLGRVCADSVINCKSIEEDIGSAIKQLFSREFLGKLLEVKNPYGGENVAEKIVRELQSCSIENIIKKTFFDLPNAGLSE